MSRRSYISQTLLLVYQVTTVKDAELRVKIVEERSSFDQDSASFRVGYDESQQKLRQQIFDARARLPSVKVSHDLRVKISKVCSELDVDGLRGDIVTNRAAKALAALRGRDEVTPKDILTLESIDSGLLVVEKFSEVFGFSSKVAA
jgi:magnesium chelatase subunit I